jgi:diguanylate cyclase (GGDEF)-like protein/PAS domain S-box-containing protein
MDIEDLALAEYLRICALDQLALLDTPQEERFDRLTRLAALSLSVPIALVSLVAAERQWFKSRVGLAATETPRSVAFCSHTVAMREMLVIEDALLDARFCDNPLVTDPPHIRFYAGQPIYSLDGQAIGTLCIIDVKPRQFDAVGRATLTDLALLVQDEVNKETIVSARVAAENALQALNAELEQRIAERTSSILEANRALQAEIRQRGQAEAVIRANEQRISTMIDTSFNAFVSIDAKGCIVDWNPAAQRIFGWAREEAMGMDMATLIIPIRYQAAHRSGMARILAGGPDNVMNKRLELPALTRRGDEISVAMTINAFDVDGSRYFGAFLHDITEQQEAHRAVERKRDLLAQKQELLDVILETIDVGIVACDASGSLSLFNRAAREFHGLSAAPVDTDNLPQHYSLYGSDGVTLLTKDQVPLLRALRGEALRDVPIVIAPADRLRRYVLASGRRLSSTDGKAIGAVIAMQDITQLNDYQQQLALGEARLRAITDNVPALIGHIDNDYRFTFLNSPALHFYGKSGKNLIGSHLSEIYSPAEFEKFGPYIKRVLAGERVEFEDMIAIRGRQKYFHASYIPDIGEDGAVKGFYALALDITARKNSEIRQQQSEERLRTIADNLPVLIAYLDTEKRYRFANARYRQWTGKDPTDMIGKTVDEVFGSAFKDERTPHFERCLEGHAVNADFMIGDGANARCVNTAFIPDVHTGGVTGVYILTTDVTAVRQQTASLHSLANTDVLTCLPNRRSYEESLSAACQRTRHGHDGVALLMLDIDHFKQVNDSMGHAGGDIVLQEFARRLLSVVRKTDVVCRLAGDEFTILLDGVPTLVSGERLAAKIVATMQAPFDINGLSMAVTTSIGAAWSAECISTKHLSALADSALYEAKAAGRNQFRSRVAVYSST